MGGRAADVADSARGVWGAWGKLNDAERGRCLVIAATSVAAAERYAARSGIDVVEMVTRRQLRAGPRWLRQLARERRISDAIAHSVDWSRQPMPQLYVLALILVPARARYIADDRNGTITRIDGRHAVRETIRLPADAAVAGYTVASESVRFATGRWRPTRPVARAAPVRDAVMAIWLGGLDSPVGGSITHMSGMLAGFKEQGMRVGLVSSIEPPDQLAEVIDDLELTRPLRRGARAANDVSRLADNRTAREAGRRLAQSMRPAFLYQRHSRFFVAGPDIARHAGVPLALEWNCSEAWTRANWEEPPAPFRVLDPMLCSMERRVVLRAAKVLAVSRPAADMALAAGADPAAVVVIPNATHVAEIRALTDGTHPRGQKRVLVGWIGSFGVWHGATVLIKSMAQLTGVDLLMIGDGWERDACQRLADSLGIAERIEWAGSLPHAEAVRRLAECDVLASPHVPLDGQAFFGSPTKLFEYMAIGRPIVASDLEQLGEVLEDGRTALLVRPGDPAALAARIAEIAELPDRGAALGAAARQEATQRHDWVHRADAVLTSVLGPEAMAA